jgi:hypothetical protein
MLHGSPWCNPEDTVTTAGSWNSNYYYYNYQKNPCPQQDATQFEQYRQEEIHKGIQNIFYINLEKNKLRRTNMEKALRQQHIQSSQWHRISAIRGQEPSSVCIKGLQHPKRCQGVQGILQSNLHIMQHYPAVTNTSISLIMEDDFILKNFTLLQQAISWIPNDWDIIRLECIDYEIRPYFDYINVSTLYGYTPPSLVFRANIRPPCMTEQQSPCHYCGGAFAMVWRSSSLSKLWDLWSTPPIGDPDCALALAPNIQSYCINTYGAIGEHKPPWAEDSDIPKLNDNDKV